LLSIFSLLSCELCVSTVPESSARRVASAAENARASVRAATEKENTSSREKGEKREINEFCCRQLFRSFFLLARSLFFHRPFFVLGPNASCCPAFSRALLLPEVSPPARRGGSGICLSIAVRRSGICSSQCPNSRGTEKLSKATDDRRPRPRPPPTPISAPPKRPCAPRSRRRSWRYRTRRWPDRVRVVYLLGLREREGESRILFHFFAECSSHLDPLQKKTII